MTETGKNNNEVITVEEVKGEGKMKEKMSTKKKIAIAAGIGGTLLVAGGIVLLCCGGKHSSDDSCADAGDTGVVDDNMSDDIGIDESLGFVQPI